MSEEEFSIGATFYHNGRKCYVRAIVDGMICFRMWLRTRQRWHYEVEPAWLLAKFSTKRPLR